LSQEDVLKNILNPLRDDYDFIIIDLYASLSLITVNALTAAGSVIVPVQANFFLHWKGLGEDYWSVP